MPVIINGTTGISGADGSATTPALQGTDANTGVYFPAADTVAVATNGTGRLFVDSSGRIGIGTSSQSSYNASADDLVIGDHVGAHGITLCAQNNSASYIMFADGTTGQQAYEGQITYDHANNFLSFNTSGAERFRCDSSGRVLVGTSSTSAAARAVFQGYNAVSDLGIVHISTALTNPSSTFVLGALRFSNSVQNTGAEISAVASQNWTSGSAQGTNLVFSTTADGASSPTERMRVDKDGQFFFRCTGLSGDAPNAVGSVLLQTNGNSKIRGGSTSGLTADTIFQFYHGTKTTADGSIAVSPSGTSYNTTSDYRRKENETAIADGIERLVKLKPYRFNFIGLPDHVVDGFFAHEVQDIVPEAITGEKDAVDDDGNPIYQGIDQSKLVPLLTAALQEAIAKIETLESKVAALEAA